LDPRIAVDNSGLPQKRLIVGGTDENHKKSLNCGNDIAAKWRLWFMCGNLGAGMPCFRVFGGLVTEQDGQRAAWYVFN
jgi:hypothetical protein